MPSPKKVSAEPTRFSVKRVSRREWVGLGAGVVATLALFLPWTNLSATQQIVEEALRELPRSDVARDAWTTGFLAWCGPLLVLLAGIVVVAFGQFRKVRVAGLPHLWLICAAVAVLLMVLGWFAMGWQFDEDTRGLLDAGGVGLYAGPGRYLGMLGAVASLVAAVLDVRALRRR
ncbi:hypothetical protein [Amycolatopsis thermophila]|uniref:Drug/metabolite transporter (DMT)-like permease n=1 Tax=Amycolatopsis thermophila TaxID=206084 RepID=A0ABU0EPW7_9PSEU|nr:hypothetical protein [Amycolatopsis thermophila]MDQ0376837.1 drug/metabolite transporter (DMT)-like permease [Amycolatopsis thermophila]